MGNKLIVGNMKMNLTIEEVSLYLKKIEDLDHSNVVICPTSIYIQYFFKKNFQVGLQNIFFQEEGAYTGELSVKQAASMHISYVIVGHSERRIYFNESDSDINKKIQVALKYHRKVIFCIGETSEDKNMLRTERVLKRQIVNGLRNIDPALFPYIYIAYEPVWAIGSNVTPKMKDIRDAVFYIQSIVKNAHDYDSIKVLYGGSVTEKNIQQLLEIENLAGVLVGSASQNPETFLKMIKVATSE